MRRCLGTAAAIVVALSCVPANALTLTGAGARSCQSWLNSHAAATITSDDPASNWAFGYLDGLSGFVAQYDTVKGYPQRDLLSRLDRASIVKLVNIYCAGHPERTIQEAVTEVGAQLVAEDRSGDRARDWRPSSAANVVVGPPRPRVETTGSGEITGSIRSAASPVCRVIIVTNANGDTLHRLRKCD